MEVPPGVRDSKTTASSREPAPLDEARKRVLIVEDDDAVASLYRRALARPDYLLYRASNGNEAVSLVESTAFDAIVSDLSMPGRNGAALLRSVREHDRRVPIVIVTGKPEVDSAITAVECGALRYLVKPVCIRELRDSVAQAIGVRSSLGSSANAAAMANETPAAPPRKPTAVDLATAFETLHVLYQPIVRPRLGRVVGYEALVRTLHPSLFHPRELLAAAAGLGAIQELGRKVRLAVARTMDELEGKPLIFVNLHGNELLDGELYTRANALWERAARVVFELTEHVRVEGMERRLRTLRNSGFRVAIDDLGAGYAALNQLVALDPDFAKIDMSLVRDVDRDPSKRMLVSSLVSVCGKLGVALVCEGVETEREARCLIGIGADLQQGYYYSEPRAPSDLVSRLPFVRRMKELRAPSPVDHASL
jgi:EAL domain-containing protein (putative c-di-GMP-specific phosphodiesterase class I)